MKTQKITPPSGYDIDKDKSTFEEIVFKPIDNWVRSWDDLMIPPCFIEIKDPENNVSYASIPLTLDKNLLKYINIQQLIDLRDHVNGGWQPEFKIDSNVFYCIYPYNGDLGVYTVFKVSAILAFKNKETAERFLETHRELIESVKEFL